MRPINYLDFDLLLQRDGPHYQVRASGPAGESQENFEVPFSELELENFLLKIGQPRRGNRRIDAPQVDATKEFGGRLYRALFKGEVLASLQRSIDQARRQKQGLRLRLRLNDAPELAGLPWEYLYNQNLNQFLAQCRETPVVRYLDLPTLIPSLGVELPLHILVIVAAPKDVPELNTSDEWRRLQDSLAPLVQRGRVVLERLPQSTLEALQQRLRDPGINVLHFIGHGGYSTDAHDGNLLFENENRFSDAVSGNKLGVLLRNHPSLRLVMVNACDGARASQSDPFAGIAQNLVQQGVPAVIAMQFEISDQAARVFAGEFYRSLVDNYPVDAAIVEARIAIFLKGLGAEWGTPVLFMRAPDGNLFDVQDQDLSSGKGSITDEVLRPFPKLHSLELTAFVVSSLSVISALLYFQYENQWNAIVGLKALVQGSKNPLGFSCATLFLASAAIYTLWKAKLWSADWLRRMRAILLLAMLIGGVGYSVAVLPKTDRTIQRLDFSVTDKATGKPLGAATVKLFADDLFLTEDISDSNGGYRFILPSRYSSSRIRVEVQHQGYLTARVDGVVPSSMTQAIQLQPSPPPPPPPVTVLKFKSTFHFSQLPITLSTSLDSAHFRYGFSSVEVDKQVKGGGVRVKSVQVYLKVLLHSGYPGCDAWVLLGPGPSMFPVGGGSETTMYPTGLHLGADVAPVQAQFVIGNAGKPIPQESTISFHATYNFDDKEWSGDIDNARKEFISRALDLPNGLNAQVFLWNGNPGVNVDVESVTVVVEGTKLRQE